jgi:membrane-associated protease RseP (regulator of RpoE activity)
LYGLSPAARDATICRRCVPFRQRHACIDGEACWIDAACRVARSLQRRARMETTPLPWRSAPARLVTLALPSLAALALAVLAVAVLHPVAPPPALFAVLAPQHRAVAPQHVPFRELPIATREVRRVPRVAFESLFLLGGGTHCKPLGEHSSTGFKLYGIRPWGPLARLGLENGDTIVRVNGVDMGDPSDLWRAYDGGRMPPRATLEVVRAGARHVYDYSLTDELARAPGR